MSTINCPACGHENDDTNATCEECGVNFARLAASKKETVEKKEEPQTRFWRLVLAAIVAILFVFWWLSSLGGSSSSTLPRATVAPTTYNVVYSVNGIGTDSASLTIENESGNTEQMDVTLPWSKKFTAESGQFIYVSAQNDNDSGSIRCQIIVDTRVVEEAQSEGAYVIASCSGSVGD